MKKNVLALSISAALGVVSMGGAHAMTGALSGATAASFLSLSESGVGHSLFVPYFSAQDKNNTLINIVNTDQVNGKAVKVRFRGAANSDDLFDFQVFLSPGDVWSASISQGSDGFAKLSTSDASCTKPAKAVLNATPFQTTRLDTANLTGDALAAGTREGYVEIFNMADIPRGWVNGGVVTNESVKDDGTAAHLTHALGTNAANTKQGFVGTVGTNTNALYAAIKHVAGVAPCAMATANDGSGNAFTAFDATDFASTAAAKTAGMLPPSTGLMANWTIINTVGAAAWAGQATAVQAVTAAAATVPPTANPAALGNVVYWPQTGTKVAAGAIINTFTADPLLRNANTFKGLDVNGAAGTVAAAQSITALNVDLPDMSTPYAADATPGATGPLMQTLSLTAALATKSISNEYLTDQSISGTTDWVFSMPTRRYHVAFHYGATISTAAGTYDDGRRFTDLTGAVAAPAAMTIGYFLPGNTTINQPSATNVNGRQICVTGITRTAYDREETTVTGSTAVVVSPATVAPTVAFCGEASVISINNGGTSKPSGSLKSTVTRTDYTLPYVDGWMRMTTPPAATTVFAAGNPFAAATPAPIGLPVVGAAFARAVGGTGTFGATWAHRYQR